MKPAFKIVAVLNICVLFILFGIWWANGRDDTWLYIACAAIVLSSFLYMTPQKKDKE